MQQNAFSLGRFPRQSMMTVPLNRTVFAIGIATAIAVARVSAQSVERSVALGVAVPTGGLGAFRSLGPLLRGAVTLGNRERRNVRLRLELESAWLVGDEKRAPSGSWSAGTFHTVSGLAAMIVGARGTPSAAPYLLLGLGMQQMSVEGAKNPYGLSVGVRAGVGLQWRAGRRTMFGELATHAAATDFGTTSDFSLATYVPVAIGIRF
jgi:hypothetical protein